MSKLQNYSIKGVLAPKSAAQFLTALGFVLGFMAFTATGEARGAPDSGQEGWEGQGARLRLRPGQLQGAHRRPEDLP